MEVIKKNDAMAPSTSRRLKEAYDASLQEQEKESSPCKKPYRRMPPPSDHHTISGKGSMLTSTSIPEQQESPSSPENSPGNSNIVGNTGNQKESINTVIKLMNDDINMSIAQWTNSFMESEQYEAYSLKQLDQLLLQADAVEKDLLQQKELLCKRLADLSKALKV